MYFGDTNRGRFVILHAIPHLPADVVVGGNQTESALMRMEYPARTARSVTRIKLQKRHEFFPIQVFQNVAWSTIEGRQHGICICGREQEMIKPWLMIGVCYSRSSSRGRVSINELLGSFCLLQLIFLALPLHIPDLVTYAQHNAPE